MKKTLEEIALSGLAGKLNPTQYVEAMIDNGLARENGGIHYVDVYLRGGKSFSLNVETGIKSSITVNESETDRVDQEFTKHLEALLMGKMSVSPSFVKLRKGLEPDVAQDLKEIAKSGLAGNLDQKEYIKVMKEAGLSRDGYIDVPNFQGGKSFVLNTKTGIDYTVKLSESEEATVKKEFTKHLEALSMGEMSISPSFVKLRTGVEFNPEPVSEDTLDFLKSRPDFLAAEKAALQPDFSEVKKADPAYQKAAAEKAAAKAREENLRGGSYWYKNK